MVSDSAGMHYNTFCSILNSTVACKNPHKHINNIQNTTYTHTQILDITLTNTYITYKIAHENQHTTQNIGMRMYRDAKYDVVYQNQHT